MYEGQRDGCVFRFVWRGGKDRGGGGGPKTVTQPFLRSFSLLVR